MPPETGYDWTLLAVLIAAMNLSLSVAVTIHAVLWKRDSRSVIGWVGLVWLVPLVGALSYWVLGINRIRRTASRLSLGTTGAGQHCPTQITEQAARSRDFLASKYPALVGLANAGRSLTGERLLPGNDVAPLVDGDEAFPAMLDAIAHAERSVALLSYIFDFDRVGEPFVRALADAAARGVEVRVLVDDVGSKYGRPNVVRKLKQQGVRVEAFLPTRLPRLPRYANMRNHRKILVVDGKIGFTGGTNIREGHTLALQPAYPVQCLHFRVTGPVVAHLQRVFAVDWYCAAGEQLRGDRWFPSLAPVGDIWARGVEHGPDENFEKLPDLIAAALATAQHRVRVLTPYFLPDPSLIRALTVAAMRGVAVEIYIPRENNIALVQWASTAQLWQVLEKGCRVFSTPSPFDHTKLMLVDQVWTLIGSTNWDPRSLRLNFEFNVECYGEAFAQNMNDIVDRKVAQAEEITSDRINARTFPVRLRDGLARLFTPYL